MLQISKFFPPVMGGIEAVAWELAEGLFRAGIDSEVLCANTGLRTVCDRQALGYQVTRVGQWARVLSTSLAPSMPAHLRRRMREADVVHVHMPDPMAALALWLARPNCPLVVHWHSDVIRQRRALKLYEPLQTWLLGRADAIVATSPPYAEASRPLQHWRDKVSVIPIGVSDNRNLVQSERVESLRRRFGHRRIVFSLGRLTYYKGFDVLLDAARQLSEECVVLIGGEGDMQANLRFRIAEQHLGDRVFLLGKIPEDDLANYYAACDVFCLPSTERAEAYGVAILEAMVMGRPVVSTQIPGSGVSWLNVNGMTGLNVPAGKAEALGLALKQLLEDEPLRLRMGAAARKRYETEFTASQMNWRFQQLYRGLVPH